MPDAKKPSKPTSKRASDDSSSSTRRARRTPAARPPASAYLEGRDAENETFDESDDLVSSRPVAVGGAALSDRLSSYAEDGSPVIGGDGTSTFDDDLFALGAEGSEAVSVAPSDGPPEIEHPRAELIAGLLALLLAGSTFLPWFKYALGTTSGWAAGQFGPLVTFLGAAGVAIVGLRKLGKNIAFPVDHALVVEGLAWLSTLAILGSNLRRPKVGFYPTQSQIYLFASLFLAVGLALWAGRISSGAPFVIRPGWHRSAAGKLGAVILILALGSGAAFGFLNGGTASTKTASTANQPPSQIQGEPPCMKQLKFPIPTGVKAGYGFPETGGVCTAILTSSLKVSSVYSRMRSALTDAGWKFKLPPQGKGTAATIRALDLTAPTCGKVFIAADVAKKRTQVVIQLMSCTQVRPTPGKN